MSSLTYAGDCSAPYDPATGAGMLHKIVGPDARGRWHQITAATYDPDADATRLTFTALTHPSHQLDRLVDQ